MSGALERFLIARGERIVRVAPKHMAGARRSSRERGKSDSIDAFSVARAALKEGIENLPGAHLDGAALDIRLLVDHREDLIAARAPAISSGCAGICTTSGPSSRSRPARWTPPSGSGRPRRRLARAEQTTRVRIARELVRQITARTSRIRELEAELAALVESYAPQLLAERGCGPLTAAKLIGEIAGADRFATDAKLARTSGSRADPRLLGQHPAPPPRPRRQPPAQLRPAPPRRQQRQLGPRHRRLPRPQTSRRQITQRSAPLPQTPPRPPRLETPPRPPAHHPRNLTAAGPDHRHRSLIHALLDIGATSVAESGPRMVG